MQTANVIVALGGDTGNTVPRYGVTAAEITVLRAIHGDEAVFDVEPAGEIDRSNREERQRLAEVYRARDGENKLVIDSLFPGSGARVPETLDELELPEEFFKPVSRASASATPVAGKKPARKPAKQAAPAPVDAGDEDDGIGDL